LTELDGTKNVSKVKLNNFPVFSTKKREKSIFAGKLLKIPFSLFGLQNNFFLKNVIILIKMTILVEKKIAKIIMAPFLLLCRTTVMGPLVKPVL
jgi:hypothetical protein